MTVKFVVGTPLEPGKVKIFGQLEFKDVTQNKKKFKSLENFQSKQVNLLKSSFSCVYRNKNKNAGR